ncbi:MAG TPA: fasciclin domain-containing protein [Pyrinomonadaceae bacterium]|nr:fasciclin domain-containing protein [Pyrinomonadaceae bacterium]
MEKQFDIIDTAFSAGNFSTLAAALGAAGLIETLKGDGPFTVFAPTDEAFSKIPSERLSELLQPENKEQLVAILTYHVVSGRVTADDVAKLESATSLQGQTLKISTKDGIRINDAKVLTPDVQATNGVIHIIDAVLMPSAAATA